MSHHDTSTDSTAASTPTASGPTDDVTDAVALPIQCRTTITDDGHRCNTTLDADDYAGMQRPPRDSPFPSTTGKFHAFDCPDCGDTHYVCPVCDDGTFDTHDSGTLICHNCHPEAAHQQDRRAEQHAAPQRSPRRRR